MRALITTLALLSVPATAAAQSAPLELTAVLASVERHHPLVAAAERDRDAADAERRAAEGSFDPQWRTRAFVAPVGYYNPLTIDTALVQPTRLWGATLFAGWRLGEGLSYTGIPIYDTISTVVWKSLKLVGADPRRITGWGRLFREVP